MTRSFAVALTLSILAALALPLSANAQAVSGKGGGQPARGGGGGGGGGGGRPAPSFHAAPAPHFSAPAVRSAPHFSAPAVRSAPHFSAPQVRSAPRFTGPSPRIHSSSPQFTTHRNISRSNVGRLNVQQHSNQVRVLQRQERILRRTENRQLRSLPANQRAARRLEIQNARHLRAQQRLNIQSGTAQTQVRGLRRSGQPRVTTQAARSGRFASTFATAGRRHHHRGADLAAHHAWRHGRRADFVPWYGPVFWPYAYSDVFDYAFWPYGYDDGYWFYAYDDFFDGIFWGEYGPPADYAYAPPYAGSSSSRSSRASYAQVRELCTQPGSGVTAWPFAEIERKVVLNGEQKQLLDDLRKAGSDAAAGFKASCPAENTFPLTPPGRLAAMTARLNATLQAVQTVRPAMEKFYDSLSDEQKERFNSIAPGKPGNAEAAQASTGAKSCKEQKPGLTNLPIERIEDAAKPTDAQEAELKKLEDATAKGVTILQMVCPDETPLTPPGRLQAMESRLKGMIEAANTVKEPLESFYGSLTAEQKARFNRIGQTLAQTND